MTALRRTTPAPPVRLVHLGVGAFSRAHQAWYTDRAPDAAGWGIAAFTGRRPDLAAALGGQDGLYTLVTRGAADEFAVVGSLASAHAATDGGAWLRHLADPQVAAVTITVTEAGYRWESDEVAALRSAGLVRSAPARLVAGLLARRRADAGPLALVPCDNLPDNGGVLQRAVLELADAVDGGLADWVGGQVSFVTTMVDRITPATTDADRATVLAATGAADACPVVTEAFSEWVLAGDFPAGRPAWDAAGARLTADVGPYEERKLWLLNAAHSIMAYTGLSRGHRTVADAVADPVCRALVEGWWDTCAPYLQLPAAEVTAYRAALLTRYANPRIRHELAQIGTDGSQKLPVRFLPVLRQERAAGRLPEPAVAVLAAWTSYLRGPEVRDVRAGELVPLAGDVPRLLAALAPELADDAELRSAVLDRLP